MKTCSSGRNRAILEQYLMGKRKAFRLYAGAFLAAALGLGGCDDQSSGACNGSNCQHPTSSNAGNAIRALVKEVAAAADAKWSVANETDDPLTHHSVLTATMTKSIDEGGEMDVKATCPDMQTIALEFDVVGPDDKKLGFAYNKYNENMPGEGDTVGLLYRLDSGHRFFIANSLSNNNNYVNVVKAVFSLNPGKLTDLDNGEDPEVGEEAAHYLSGEFGMIPDQDIIALLSAKDAQFQIALDDGRKELIDFHPQEQSFQSFVSQCKMNLQGMKVLTWAKDHMPQKSDGPADQPDAQTGQEQPTNPQPDNSAPSQSVDLQTDSDHPQFDKYQQDGFTLEVPRDLWTGARSGQVTNFTSSNGRSLRFETGTAEGSLQEWLSSQYAQDSQKAVAQSGSGQPYLFPSSGGGHIWSASGDYYVASWNDENGTTHYRVLVAEPNNSDLKWASSETTAPTSFRPLCKSEPGFMLDTLLMSANVKSSVRDPRCPS